MSDTLTDDQIETIRCHASEGVYPHASVVVEMANEVRRLRGLITQAEWVAMYGYDDTAGCPWCGSVRWPEDPQRAHEPTCPAFPPASVRPSTP